MVRSAHLVSEYSPRVSTLSCSLTTRARTAHKLPSCHFCPVFRELSPTSMSRPFGYERASFDPTAADTTLAPGWSVLTCAGGLSPTTCTGPTFTQNCDLDTASCNAGVLPDRIPNHQHWLGRPTVVAEPIRPGPLTSTILGARPAVYVTLVDTDGDITTAESVAAIPSRDGGTTFGFNAAHPGTPLKTITVNNGNGCGSGQQDFPSAAYDYTTAP